MTGPLIDRQLDRTVEHNDIVPALLGLLKMLDDISVRLEAEAAGPTYPPKSATAADREAVLAMLGLLRLRRTLHNWLGQCAPSAPHARSMQLEPETVETNLLR